MITPLKNHQPLVTSNSRFHDLPLLWRKQQSWGKFNTANALVVGTVTCPAFCGPGPSFQGQGISQELPKEAIPWEYFLVWCARSDPIECAMQSTTVYFLTPSRICIAMRRFSFFFFFPLLIFWSDLDLLLAFGHSHLYNSPILLHTSRPQYHAGDAYLTYLMYFVSVHRNLYPGIGMFIYAFCLAALVVQYKIHVLTGKDIHVKTQ